MGRIGGLWTPVKTAFYFFAARLLFLLFLMAVDFPRLRQVG